MAEQSTWNKSDRTWIYVQKKTFTNWVNDKLKATEYQVEDLQIDLKDGLVLITLLQVLAPGKKMPRRYKAKPRMDVHKRENLTIVFEFMLDVEKIPMVNLGAMDIYQCNLKLILGLIWTLILRYQIAGPVAPQSSTKKGKKASKEQKSAKKLLINWVNVVIPKCKVSNFSDSWNDGLALSALVDYCKPGLLPNHTSLDPSNGLENIKNAMDIAERELGVPQVMHPEDMAVEKPDELSVMTYVSGFSHQNSAGQSSLLVWINQQIPHHQVTNLSSDWTNGLALGALTDVLSGGQFPEYEKMSSETPEKNCNIVMEKAKDLLEIELLATPEEFASESLNQLTRVSYLAQFQSCKQKSLIDFLQVTGGGVTGGFVGQKATFTVSAEKIPKWASIHARVSTAAGKKIEVAEENRSESTITFSYTPEEDGEYVIEIDMNDTSLPELRAKHSIPTYSSKCKASGDGLKRACVGKKAEFNVDCEQGGVGELKVRVQGPNDKVSVTTEETKPQNFDINYTPKEAGVHEIEINWGSEQIPESPFQSAVVDPSKCSVNGLTQAHVNVPQTFVVDASSAGPGELSVKCQGPVSEIPVEINKQQNQTYSCNYTPQESGNHAFDIYWSDHPITESPIQVDVIVPTYSSKCKASGDGLKRACVGKKAEFNVDCEQGGVGELKVRVQGPNDKVSVTTEETKPQNFEITYTPKEAGTHEISINWGSEQIPESPFQSAVVDPSKCSISGLTQAHVNVPQTFFVDASSAGPGELSVKCQGPVSEIPVEINKQQNQTYSCNYTPQESGNHAFDIYWSDHPITESPIQVDVIVPTYSSKCKASGDGLKRACVGKKAEFNVDCEQGGVGELKVRVQGPNDKVSVTTEETKPQNFEITYTPKEAGTHEISINWGSEQIPESPFQSAVVDPSKCSISGLTQAHVNVPQTFVVDASSAGPGELSVKCQGPVSEIPVEINKQQNQTYSCNYTPQEFGNHTFDIYWSDHPITESPIQVDVIVPTYSSKCKASGDGLKRACVGKKAEFNVDCEQGGVGELQVRVQGPNDKVSVTIEETKPQNFDINYTPKEAGGHEIEVNWGSEQIPESPFQSAVVDPSKCSVSRLTQAHVNVPQTFVVDASSAGPGELSVKCQGPVSEIPVEINKQQNQTYSCNYTPQEFGNHTFDIYWSDHPITESPIQVDVIVPTYSSKCKASGDGLKRACVGKKAEFNVDCEQGGVGELKVRVQGPNDKVSVTTEETKPQNFEITYTPKEAGTHEISINWGSEQIPESPFQSAVVDPSKCSISGLTQAHVNVPQTFVVDASSAGPGELSVKCQGPVSEIPVEINKQQNQTYSCNYTPQEFGNHTFDIYWSDHPITESPIQVDVIVPTYSSKCKVSGDGLKRACVGKKAEFNVDCEQGGVGELKVRVQGPNDKVSVTTEETKPQNFEITYTPKEAGTHEISINWGSEQIPESPFQSAVVDPSKCSISGLTQAHVNVPQTFVVDASSAGPGELSVKCQGPVSEIPVEINKQPNQTYSCNYTPQEFGNHTFDIYWSDHPITESPIQVDVIVPTYSSKCKASGDGLKRACVGKKAKFKVDCEQGGVGELKVRVQGPNDKVSVTTEETKPQNFEISYTPKEAGVHEIEVNWGSEQIPESPFQSAVVDPSKCSISGLTQAHVNVPQTFVVDASSAGPGELSVKCQGPFSEIPVEINKQQNQTYSCNYTPQEPGSHTFDIYWSDHPITESPIQVDVIVPTYSSKCKASGDGLKRVCVGKKAKFKVDCEQGGVGELKVRVQGPNDKVSVTTEETKPQNFEITYTPKEAGTHEISINWGNEQIPESPFQSAVVNPSKCSVNGLTQAHVNVPQTFVVDASSAGPGELSVKCQGPVSEIPVEINKQQNQTYSCNYTPQESGSHTFDIYWSDHPITESPIQIDVIVPTYSSKCKASGDGLKRACVGKKAEFNVDCEQGGVGELQVRVQGPNDKVSVTTEETKPQNFEITYTPKEAGTHEISINWGSEQIPESPFQSAVVDPSKCSVNGLTQAHVNVPQTFVVDASSAGPGELSVKCQGLVSEIPVEINKQQNQTYSCNYTPQESGSHTFDIYWSDHPITESPIQVDVIVPTYSNKCKASGDGLKRACVGKKAEFNVDCEQGGVGELKVRVQGPNDKVSVTTEETKPQNFDINYTPKEAGVHEIEVNWGSEQIPESPFQSAVVDPSKCSVNGLTQAHVNVPQTFVVDASSAGPGELSVKCQGPVSEIPVEINKQQNQTYSCNYTPQESGNHAFDIYWSDHPITESPIQVKTLAFADPNKCIVTDIPQGSLHVDTSYSFDVITGQPDHEYNLAVSTNNGSKLSSCEIDCNTPTGICTVHLTPIDEGPLSLDVTCNGVSIPSTPLSFNVIDLSKPIQESCDFQMLQNIEEAINLPGDLLQSTPASEIEKVNVKEVGESVEDLVIEIGEPLTYIIDLESKDTNKQFRATATGQDTCPIDVPVVKNADNTITLSFSPSKPGHYSIELTADNEPIPTGPFRVTFIEPKKLRESQNASWVPEKKDAPEKVSFKYERRHVNAQINLSVNSSQVEASGTAVSVQEASTAKPVASSLSELLSGGYHLEFTTTDEQEYTVVLQYRLKVSHGDSGNKLQLLGMPFALTSTI